MLERVLTPGEEKVLAEERRALSDLRAELARLGAPAEDEAALERAARQIDEPFLLVVVGEFNSGKSAFLNALLGAPVLEEGVLPTTRDLQVVVHHDQLGAAAREPGLELVGAAAELLRHVRLVDTPGTNAIERQHEALTERFVPRADLVLFVTSADRPFSESERAFLQRIREWGKKVVFVVNKIDILEEAREIERVTGFVRDGARALLGVEAPVFPVSARKALRARTGAAPQLRAESRFEAVERYVASVLEERERVRLKLLSPLGVGLRLAERHLDSAQAALGLLASDITTVEQVSRQLELYRSDLSRDFRFRLSDVENVLLAFESRGLEFFEESVRFGRVFELLNRERLKDAFERKVVADTPRQVEERVLEIIEWLVASEFRQWRAVTETLEQGRERHKQRVVGRIAAGLEQDRGRLLETVGRAARATIDGYDREAEAARIADSVRTAVAGTALLGAGAVGLGTAVTLLASSTAADVTGILAAGALAAIGLFVIPARRARAKSELRKTVADLRAKLVEALVGQFEREADGSVQRIQEAIAPYTRFVLGERARLAEAHARLGGLRESLLGLKSRVERL